MKYSRNTRSPFTDLTALFFETRQIIRMHVPQKGKKDPNEWLRLEILRFIAEADAPTMQMIASHLHIAAPSATSLVATLHRSGLVERQAGKDKRVRCVILTTKGKRVLQSYLRHSEELMTAVFGRLSKKQIDTLLSILADVVASHAR